LSIRLTIFISRPRRGQNKGSASNTFETEAEHLRDGDDVLPDGNIAQDLLLDVLGKEQGALLVT
jgi:hypothetical protein